MPDPDQPSDVPSLHPVEPYRVYLADPDVGWGPGSFSEADYSEERAAGPGVCGFKRLGVFYPLTAEYVREELGRLFRPYRISITIGSCQYAPSSTWRDEHSMLQVMNNSSPRFAVRAHIFAGAHARPGRYLGFVCLRPEEAVLACSRDKGQDFRKGFSYVIDAELGQPGHMLRPRYHVLTTTSSSARLGILPFRSAVYSCCSRQEERGSTCVHIAVSQGLHLMMGRFGCRPVSQIEFDTLLWRITPRAGKAIGEMGRLGATPEEALKVLLQPECNAGGFLISREPSKQDRPMTPRDKWAVMRHITDSLACGLPVIAIVDGDAIYNALPLDDGAPATPPAGESIPAAGRSRGKGPHAVLIVGMRLLHSRTETDELLQQNWQNREDLAELPGRVVLHDPMVQGPYFEWCTGDFLKAAEAAYCNRDEPEQTPDEPARNPGEPKQKQYPGIHLLVMGSAKMKMGIHQARFYTEQHIRLELGTGVLPLYHCLRNYSARIRPGKIPPLRQWRLVCRLGNLDELESRYQRHAAGAIQTAVKAERLRRDARHFWAVEVHLPEAPSSVRDGPDSLLPAAVYIWDTTREMTFAGNPESDLILGWRTSAAHPVAGVLVDVTI